MEVKLKTCIEAVRHYNMMLTQMLCEHESMFTVRAYVFSMRAALVSLSYETVNQYCQFDSIYFSFFWNIWEISALPQK